MQQNVWMELASNEIWVCSKIANTDTHTYAHTHSHKTIYFSNLSFEIKVVKSKLRMVQSLNLKHQSFAVKLTCYFKMSIVEGTLKQA